MILNSYKRRSLAFSQGKGCWLWDRKGKCYLDMIAGYATCILGHCHTDVTQAIKQQAETLVHTSNLYQIPLQEKLAETLCEITQFSGAYFCNSGAEANEAAIKLARVFAHKRQISNPKIIVMSGGFHGRTLATLSATMQGGSKSIFEPLIQGFISVEYNNITQLKQTLNSHDDIVAILFEPIQGVGGIHVATDLFSQQLRCLATEHNCLLICDEIQTGMGRTGKFFCYEHHEIKPDIVTVAKGLANGLPIGACLVNTTCKDLFSPGDHGSTFGGNPLVCAASLAVIDILFKEHILENVRYISQILRAELQCLFNRLGLEYVIRGKGLMLGLEFVGCNNKLVETAENNYLLINVILGKVLRLLPPLILSETEVDIFITKLTKCIVSLMTNKRSFKCMI